jgi:4-hydroxy 2-oxovalerate aldolase
MYREQVKVLDCTIRDGGLINNHYFTDEFVRAVYKAVSEAKIDYVEMGYRSSRKATPPDKYGPWKYCDDDTIREITDGIESETKICIMIDAGQMNELEFKPVDQSPVDMIRVAAFIKDIDKAVAAVEIVHDLGYECAVNIRAISMEKESVLVEALKKLAKTPAQTVYVVDSYGHFFSEQIHSMTELYQKYLPNKRLGIHCHNNLQLAFANTIEGVRNGCSMVDASLFGIGRGAGNCPLELIMGFLKNPKFRLEPILKVIEDYMIPMRNELEWGYLIPFMITGILNSRSEPAAKMRKTKNKDKYAEFYNELLSASDVIA